MRTKPAFIEELEADIGLRNEESDRLDRDRLYHSLFTGSAETILTNCNGWHLDSHTANGELPRAAVE